MTGCRSSGRRGLAGLALLALLAGAGAETGSAQTRGPIVLGPPAPSGTAATGPASPAPAAPDSALSGHGATGTPGVAAPPPGAVLPARPPAPAGPRTTADGAIRIESLGRLTADAAGTLTPGSGGLRADLWSGTPAAVAMRLVSLLPASPDSHALRALQRRLLLSTAPAPADLVEGDLLAARAERLLAMGALDDLAALAAAVPGRGEPPGLARAMAERALALGDDDAACGRGGASGTDGRFWARLGVVCDLRRGDIAKAELGVRLLAELGRADVPLQDLVQAAAGGGGGPQRLAGAGPIGFAAARAARLPIDPDVAAIDSLPVLVGLARGVGSPPFAARLAAADKAERAGALATAALLELYAEVAVQGGSVDGTLKVAEADPGPYGRALLWRAADTNADVGQQVRAIRKALELAREAGDRRQVARLFAPIIRRLQPGPATAALAADAIRAFVAAGDAEAAGPWVEWLRDGAAVGNARNAARDVWTVTHIGGGERLAPYREVAVTEWWDGLRTVDPGKAAERGAAALTLLDALGAPLGPDAWRGLATAPATLQYQAPTAAFRNGVAAGAAAGRLGETVALACAGFGGAALASVDPTAVAGVVAALRRLGLEDDARRFAGEAAVAYGL